VKPKTAFESGNSPPMVSESGAPVLTGRGLEETKRRIMEAFEKARQQHPTQPVARVEPTPTPQVEYTSQHETHFRERSNRLAVRALESPHIVKVARNNGVWDVEVPSKTAEELIAEALRRDK
jgi:hypothetical protein